MHATRTPGTLDSRVISSVNPQLLDRLDQVETTANSHRAASVRLAGAHDERERREAARDEAAAREAHRAALTKLALDFRSTGMAQVAPRRG